MSFVFRHPAFLLKFSDEANCLVLQVQPEKKHVIRCISDQYSWFFDKETGKLHHVVIGDAYTGIKLDELLYHLQIHSELTKDEIDFVGQLIYQNIASYNPTRYTQSCAKTH